MKNSKPETGNWQLPTRVGKAMIQLVLLGCALIGGAVSARGDVVSPFTPSVQRFFPNGSVVSVSSLVTGTNPVNTSQNYRAGAVAYVLIGSLGGAASNPAINLYTGAGAAGKNASADPTQLYAIRIVTGSSAQLFGSWSDAMNQVNPINFTAGSTAAATIYLASSNWCWDACSQMLLGTAGFAQTQDAIADNAFSGANAGHFYNLPNWMDNKVYTISPGLTVKAIGKIINDLGSIKSAVTGQISAAQILGEVDANFPMVFRIGWYPTPGVRNGGHFISNYGIGADMDTLSLADPWPSNAPLNAAFSLSTLISTGYPPNGTWEATLVNTPLDLLILVDTTGSMTDSLDSVESAVSDIIDEVAADFPDFRVALADFKDDPIWDGDPDDYVYEADVPFTSGTAGGVDALNNGLSQLSASGGGDIPEAQYSALANGLAGNGIGPWRTGADTQRVIVMITDAPGHDPEMWPGGTNSGAVIATATNAMLPIHIDSMIVDDYDDGPTDPFYVQAEQMGNLLAASTGGITLDPSDPTLVGGDIVQALVTTASNSRFPQGTTASIYPQFSLTDNNPVGMENSPSRITLQVEKMHGSIKWVNYKTVTVSGSAQATQLKGPVPLGTYRWRLAFNFPASEILSPDGAELDETKAHTTDESDYTEFMRVLAPPQPPTIIGPSATGFSATSTVTTYQWGAGPGATSYVLEIFSNGRLFRKLTVKPPANDPTEATLQVNVSRHVVGREYTWQIQSLNYDHPKPDPSDWVPGADDDLEAAISSPNYRGPIPATVNLAPKPKAPSAAKEVSIVTDAASEDDTSASAQASAHPELIARAEFSKLRTPDEKIEYLSRLATTPVPASMLPFLQEVINGDPSADVRSSALGAASTTDSTSTIIPVLAAALAPSQQVDLRLQALNTAAALAPSLIPQYTNDSVEEVRTAAELLLGNGP